MNGRSCFVTGACMGALLAGWVPGSDAQTTFKCTDERRRITYSNVPCDKQGLKDAGPVADRTTTMPLAPAPKAPAARESAAAPAKVPGDGETRQAPAPIQPVNPLIEKLLK